MFKNATLRDLTVFVMGTGLVLLLVTITLGDFYVALKEHKPIDESVVNLLSMAITGIVGVVAGYVTGKDKAPKA
jgi:cytochrome bd-type quinol oxidase subunit 2